MTPHTTDTTDTTADRIKLPISFDHEKLLADIENLKLESFVYYDALPLRAPAHIVDPSLPFPPPSTDYADGSWTPWKDTQILLSSPNLLSLVDYFREHTKVTLVRLLRLAPGATVKEHTDPTLGLQIPRSVIRLTVPILTNDQVTFYLNQTPVAMQPGECWYLRLTDPHSIINASESERINLSIDMIPNDWVRSLIMGN